MKAVPVSQKYPHFAIRMHILVLNMQEVQEHRHSGYLHYHSNNSSPFFIQRPEKTSRYDYAWARKSRQSRVVIFENFFKSMRAIFGPWYDWLGVVDKCLICQFVHSHRLTG